MPKKVSEIQKKEIVSTFINGLTINELSEKYNCSKITITRHLKKNISEKEYKNLLKKNNQNNQLEVSNTHDTEYKPDTNILTLEENLIKESRFCESEFMEIAPLNLEIDNKIQKDLTSISISDMDFPNVVYMVVDKKIELDIRVLSDYPEWQFLSEEELNRKAIAIYPDLKIAKRFCNKEQKVIKVPNTNVFKIVSPLLLNRGISRIVCTDKLIAL